MLASEPTSPFSRTFRLPPQSAIKTSARIRFHYTEWLRCTELILRIVVLLACIPALVFPTIITVTIHHQLTVSYAAAIFGLGLNAFEIIAVALKPRAYNSSRRSCATGMLDFLGIPLFAFGAIGAALDGSDFSGEKGPVKNTGGPLHWPEAFLMTGIAVMQLGLFVVDCVNCRPCCSPKKPSRKSGGGNGETGMRELDGEMDGNRGEEGW